MNSTYSRVWVILAITVFVIGRVWFFRKSKKNQPSFKTPFKCPSCGSEKVDVQSSSFCSDQDAGGKPGSGFVICEYGVCKRCGGHCARYDADKPYIPTDKEWRQYFDSNELAH